VRRFRGPPAQNPVIGRTDGVVLSAKAHAGGFASAGRDDELDREAGMP